MAVITISRGSFSHGREIAEKAAEIIENEDINRIQWTRYLYKMDINDPKLYDIVINIGNLTIEEACEIIIIPDNIHFRHLKPVHRHNKR